MSNFLKCKDYCNESNSCSGYFYLHLNSHVYGVFPHRRKDIFYISNRDQQKDPLRLIYIDKVEQEKHNIIWFSPKDDASKEIES